MTVTSTELRVYPSQWRVEPLGDLCRGRCKACGFRWWSPDPVAVAREHERECLRRPRQMWEAK